ncbi:uncharacterized protein LOC117652437 isoform X2 [Thrips palmi]|uniref:Uncharacterized protein LOC117652437 isoform X2 n=1 Tax=Thrips palmi TaxID=161013 RepID=A0A6P9A7E9_THRPL|nr:uncharacterized protein LOC117652437 isoform X2 [Thrips palmi]
MPRSCSDGYYLQLIYEYLLHMGLESTATNLREECRSCDYPAPEEISGVRRCDITNLLQRFDEEDEAGFLRILNQSIPLQARSSYEGKKMIADLLVYFAALSLLKDGSDQAGTVWMKPLVHAPPALFQNCEPKSMSTLMPRAIQGNRSHTSTNSETLERTELCKYCGQKSCTCENSEEPEIVVRRPSQCSENNRQRCPIHPCMNTLQEYLDTECSNLKDDPYFIPYFALPFTSSPQTHYQYKHIFQGSWPKGLRRRFWEFLVHHRQAAGLPGIVRLLPSCEVQVAQSTLWNNFFPVI